MTSSQIQNRLISKKVITDGFLKEDELLTKSYETPFHFFHYFWNQYEKSREKFKKLNSTSSKDLDQSFRSINGSAFEAIIGFLLIREKIDIISMDEHVKNVKLVKPDFIIKSKTSNIFLSLKTSVRERWKQADYEALKYKIVYSKSQCVLIVNNEKDSLDIRGKIDLLDIDEVTFANSIELNKLIERLKN